MGAGRFVGRVGGLAIAMGVGTAVSFGHGVAWADDTGDTGHTRSSESRPSTDRPEPAPSKSESESPTKDSGSAEDKDPDSDADADEPEAAAEDADDEDAERSSSSRKRKSEKEPAAKADRPTREDRVGKADDDDDDDEADAPAPMSTPTVNTPTVSAPVKSVPVPETVASVPPPAAEATAVRVTSATLSSSVLGGGQGVPADSPVAWIVAGAARRELGVPEAKASAAAVPIVAAAAPNKVPVIGIVKVNGPNATTGVVTGTVAATDADKDTLTFTAPAKTTKGAIVVNATTGAFTYTPTAAARHAAASTTATAAAKADSFTVTVSDGKGGTATKLVSVVVSPKNTAPTGGKATPGTPNATTGVVTGTLTATDADGDTVKFSGPATTSKGTLTVSGSTFTYTPTAAARLAAASSTATAADKKDTFTVTATDGFGGSAPVTVTVAIAPDTSKTSGRNVVVQGSSVNLPGRDGYSEITADGTRAVVTSIVGDSDSGYTTNIGVVNTVTGKQVGKTIAVDGDIQRFDVLDNGKALITTADTDAAGVVTTRALLVDPSTGAQVGSTLTLAGGPDNDHVFGDGETANDDYYDGVQVSADGTRIVLVTLQSNADGTESTRVAVMNASTGAKVGNTTTFTGAESFVNSAADGARLVVTTKRIDAAGAVTTRIAVVNTATGKQVGSTLTVAGQTGTPFGDSSTVQISEDGSRAAVTAVSLVSGTPKTSRVVVLNLTTGAQVGSTITESGYSTAEISRDGSKLAVATIADPAATVNAKTSVKLFNTATGAAIGTPTTLAGGALDAAQFTSDGKRLIVSTFTTKSTGLVSAVTVSTFDTATGAKVGNTVTLAATSTGDSDDADFKPVRVNAAGTRALVAAITGDEVSGNTTSYVVIDTATGKKLGSTVAVAGLEYVSGTEFSADGKRAYVDTLSTDAAGAETTRFAVINLSTGAQLGNTVVLAGNTDGWEEYSDDGTRVFLHADSYGSSGKQTSKVALIDAVTGAQVGTTRTFTGDEVWAHYVDDTSRVVVLAINGTDASGYTTTATVLNAVTGAGVGTRTVAGSVGYTFELDRAATLLASDGGWQVPGATSRLVSLNTSDATQTGGVITLPGYLENMDFSDDSQRGFIVTVTGNDATGYTTKVTSLATGAPIATKTTVGNPNSTTAVVKGSVTATDGGTVTYSGPTSTAKGTVTLNKTTGAFTYTPTAAARHEVLAPGAATTDTFTIVVKDANGRFSEVPVTVKILPGTNAAPTNVKATKSTPNAVTGAVTGTVSATDADGDTLTFSGPSTTKGTLVVNAVTGAYTYTPTAAARQKAAAAGAPAADKQDTLTFTVNDGHGAAVPVTVTVVIAPAVVTPPATTVAVTKTIVVNGMSQEGMLSADGKHAVVQSAKRDADTGVLSYGFSVIDVATGTIVGSPVVLAGESSAIQFSPDGTRALVTTNDWQQTRVAVIDTSNGVQVGSTLTFVDTVRAVPVFNSTGSRVLLATNAYSTNNTSRVGLIDTATGKLVFDTGVKPGIATAGFSADGTKAVITTVDGPVTVQQMSDYRGTVKVVNAVTGAQIGSTYSRTGYTVAALNTDGSRVVISAVTGDPSTQVYSTSVSVANTASGAAVGTPLTFAGAVAAPASFRPDGTRAVLTILDFPSTSTGGPGATKVAVVNMATGAQVGQTVIVEGSPAMVGGNVAYSQLDPTGNRVIVATNTLVSDVYTTRLAVVDTNTGLKIGNTVSVAGMSQSVQVSADGTRVLINAADPATSTSRLVVVDLTKGAKLGSTKTFATAYLPAQLTGDGSRVLVVASDGTASTVTVFDAATGAQVGTPLKVVGTLVGTPALNSDGGRAVIAFSSYSDTAMTTPVTKVIVMNTSTGLQGGKTVTINGSAYSTAQISADGTRAFMSTVSVFTPSVTLLKIT